MKSIFTLLAASLISLTGFAHPYRSSLSVTTTARFPVIVVIDNNNYSARNNNKTELTISNLQAGNHNIRIYRDQSKWNSKKYGYNDRQLVYNGNVYLKAGYEMDIMINRFGKVLVDEARATSDYDDIPEEGGHGNWNQQGNDYNNNEAMSSSDFSRLVSTIQHENFEQTKLSIANQGMSNANFSTTQVASLMGLFSFEDSKLAIAKSAFRRCVDKQNYYTVNNALSFSSSKEALNSFLQSSR